MCGCQPDSIDRLTWCWLPWLLLFTLHPADGDKAGEPGDKDTGRVREDSHYPYLDAKITGWNIRDKKIASGKMTFLRKNNFEFEGDRKKNFVEIYKQVRYNMIDIYLSQDNLCHVNVIWCPFMWRDAMWYDAMWYDVMWRFMVLILLLFSPFFPQFSQ